MRIASAIMNKRWNLGITSQLATLTIPLIGAISVFILMYFPAQLERQALKAIVGKAHHIAAIAAHNLGPSVHFEDARALEGELETLRHAEDIVYVVVMNDAGKICASYNRNKAQEAVYLRTNDVSRLPESGETFKTEVPVLYRARPAGRLYLGFSLRDLRREVATAKKSIALISIAVFIFGMVVMFTISKVVIKPLNKMVKTVEEIAKGDLSKRALVTSDDEVGHFAGAFNIMVNNLAAAYRELETINKSLEQRVENRTRALTQEIGERKLAEDSLKESEERYRTLFEEMIDVVLISSPDGRLIDINAAGVKLLGYGSKEELLQLLVTDLYFDPRERDLYVKSIEELGFLNGFELSLRKRDGEKVVVSVSANAIRNDQGVMVTYRNIMRDITNIKELERQLLESQKLETVGRLAGGIAHDFNNMLNVILGNAQLAKMLGPFEGKAGDHLSSIENAVHRAAGFVKQLLAFSRRQVLDLKVVHLNDMIADFAKMVRRFVGENIEMKIITGKTLPTVKVDVAQLHQVLLNLVVNARDSMPRGGDLTIETYSQRLDRSYCRMNVDAKPGRYAVFSVSDTGTGMDGETIKKIFEPFFTTKRVGEGTGLGLSVVYGIVKQHGGFIHVYSEPGKGTEFKIYIPSANELAESRGALEELLPGSGESILIAEDEPALREIASEILQTLGYRTMVASNGEEALQIFKTKSQEIDLVLLDVVMPKQGGKEAYEEMRKIKPSVRSLFMTGYSLGGIHTNFIREQGIDAIQKPYSSELLGQKIREVLDRQIAA
jgi:PAS domain S-box-containing protein